MSFPLDSSMADTELPVYGLALLALAADYLLVGCRLVGLLVTIPGCNPAVIPLHLRCLLVVVLAGVITPNVSLVTRHPLPPAVRHPAVEQFADRTVQPVGHADADLLDGFPIDHFSPTPGSTTRPQTVLATLTKFIGLGASELCLGLLLGLGANLILQGIRMAGQLIDQQTGWGLINSGIDGEEGGSAIGELLFWIGNVLLLVLGGHLLLISCLLETFRSWPPGCGQMPLELLPTLEHWVRQSLTLALQVSAPVLAAQVLAGVVVSHATSAAPQFQNSGVGTVLKIAIACCVILLAINGITDRLLELLPATIQMPLPTNIPRV